MNTRKALFTSKLALALVLGYVVVRAVLPPGDIYNGLAPASAKGKDRAQAIETARLPDLSLEDYAQIAKRDPFGTSGLGEWSLTADSSHFDRSVSEELGLALFGTVSGSPSVARAVIKDLKTGVFDLYKIGQVVGNARIEDIEADAVILLHNEERKKLWITAWQSNSSDNNHVSSSQTNNGRSKTLETALPSEKTDTNIRIKIEHVEEVLEKAVIEPYVVNGQIEGLRITDLENIKTGKRFGLKNGDVIRTVNGHLLTSKQKAYQIFKKARSQKTITFELLRGDKPKKLSFALW
jgi:type II secretory pathway component PulC